MHGQDGPGHDASQGWVSAARRFGKPAEDVEDVRLRSRLYSATSRPALLTYPRPPRAAGARGPCVVRGFLKQFAPDVFHPDEISTLKSPPDHFQPVNLTRYNCLVLTLGRAMKRRSGAGGKLQGRKRSTPKRRNAPKATRNRGVSIASQETVIARLTHERDEALLRETANSEILNLISKSPGDLELVFQSILENATRICNANF